MPNDLQTETVAEKDKGFTLIELLVVVVIIGVLAAIAIPIFLNQKDKAAEAGVKSDIKNASTYLESYFVDNNTYVGAETFLNDTTPTGSGFKSSDDNTITVPTEAADSYCIEGVGSTDTEFHLSSADGSVAEGGC
ncbi:prepilin-type N-terminal cleavage/methylation domain-containing protein [Nocardioides sp. 1609]|uniref:type IV pilin protein n=1 Tax=Nocardioides sp. 1609 TaxID=2508327 RepID=UPI00106FB262|nr:prepilin-type N-terminal cleavage/methylation domain-containing protein [Nocardioides sp. 1609]